jgi:hypothetical protein
MLTWHKIHFTFNFEEPRIPATISSAASTKATAAPSPPKLPRVTSSFGDMPGSVTESNNTFNTDSPDVTSGTPGLEWLVPQKMGIEKDVMSLPLTRPQRSIYMLVDGHRTISDLSRCTRKNFQEIERLLTELREQGLISI